MGNDSFNGLLQALQSALLAAQESLRETNAEALRRIGGGDGASGGPSSFFSFVLPQGGTGQDGHETLTLPSSSFRTRERPQVSMLSLTFECELRETGFPTAPRNYLLVITDGQGGRWRRKKRHWMQIVFQGPDQPVGEVRIDGRVFMEVPLYDILVENRPASEARVSIFSRLFGLLQNVWRPQGFAMTLEQSERVRTVLGQLESEAMSRSDGAAT
ncbi:MAG: hypothetical protein P4L39_09665 [Humidesulfovibrio sp.]|nr:hypothetical protein [Humidesulfovibrio sp.]